MKIKRNIKPVIIKLEKEWFRHAYYVYFVSIVKDENKMLYIGMTGDRKHKTARSPFYRMAGHFSQLSSSSENQVIKGLRKIYNIDTTNQQELVELLESCQIIYHAYPLSEFKFNIDKSEHTERRRFAEKVESFLILALKEEGKWNVINSKISNTPNDDSENQGVIILEDWKKRMENF